jgi:putative addiction module component (TIGR02574 family)
MLARDSTPVLGEAMSSTIQTLGIDRMSPEDRLRLIGEIWDSLAPIDQFEIPQSHRDELDRRLAEADADPSAGPPREEVRARLKSCSPASGPPPKPTRRNTGASGVRG